FVFGIVSCPPVYLSVTFPYYFSFLSHFALLDLLSFPTRRSSDLHNTPFINWLIFYWLSISYSPVFARFSFQNSKKSFGSQSPKGDRKSTRLNSSHVSISSAVFSLTKTTRLTPHAAT